MHWFGGSIAEAVNLSKQRNAIFVVFVEGDNELSSEMSSTLNHVEVVNKLSDQNNFLAIKLKSGSVDYTHFAQIYQFVPVPSVFFIGRNGTPLEVVCAGVEAPNLASRIERILHEHHKEGPSAVKPSTSSRSLKEQTQDLIQSETAANKTVNVVPSSSQKTTASEPPETSSVPPTKVAKTAVADSAPRSEQFEVVCDGDVCVKRPIQQDEPGPSQPAAAVEEPPSVETAADIEAKLERAKELIEIKKREKEDKERELSKQKELERRAAGQGVAELKKWQADQEMKQLQEERKRERMENNLARQRILEQIAQDRAERKARDVPVAAGTTATTPTTATTTTVPVNTPNTTAGDGVSAARIQFKLPDGSSHGAHFRADDTLADVRQYVADNLQLPSSAFSLWTAFPRRELVESDATLRRLELAPSAALLVVSRRGAQSVSRPSTFSNLITLITTMFTSFVLQPAQSAYAWVYARLFPGGGTTPRPASAPRTPSPGPGLRYRPRTNIHRLNGDRANDDDNNTWNGNSTQQM